MLKLTDKIVYKAKVETNDGINELSTNVNFGINKTEFKFKCSNHTISFRNRTNGNDSKLSKFISCLKDQNKEFDIKWSILKTFSRSKSCNLCLLKKLVISNFKEKEKLLHKWLNLESKCRHENKYINELFINSQTHCNLIVMFICNSFCIYKKLFEKVNITSKGLTIRHETQCNIKSEVLNCLTNITIYNLTLKYWPIWSNCTFIRNNNK